MGSSDEARKQRILTHMNKDHRRELSHYLRHFAGVPAAAAASPEMRDVDLQAMVIGAGPGRDYRVAFDPPLRSWLEVKTRIIDMDAAARAGLGIGDVYVTRFVPPTGFGAFVLGTVVFYFACAAALPCIVPGSPVWGLLEAGFPGGAVWFRWLVRSLFLPVVAIHAVECFFFDRRLQRYGVDRFSGLWWTWQLCCFLEGFPAFKRIDAVVAEKVKDKDAKRQ